MFHRNRPNHRNAHNSRSGFTIAEMIIVIAIMAILTAIGGLTYSKERDRFEFNNALIKTLQLIKTARTDAVTSTPIYDEATKKNVIPVDGYGVYFKLNTVRGSQKSLSSRTRE